MCACVSSVFHSLGPEATTTGAELSTSPVTLSEHTRTLTIQKATMSNRSPSPMDIDTGMEEMMQGTFAFMALLPFSYPRSVLGADTVDQSKNVGLFRPADLRPFPYSCTTYRHQFRCPYHCHKTATCERHPSGVCDGHPCKTTHQYARPPRPELVAPFAEHPTSTGETSSCNDERAAQTPANQRVRVRRRP